MCPLRRVEDVDADPNALGILVPPGRRTVLIVRPRALIWDMLLTRQGVHTDSPFRQMNQQEAAEAARGLFHALEDWYSGGPGAMQTLFCPSGESYWVGATLGPFNLLACPRIPGQPYRPMHFRSEAQASEAADALASVLFPSCDRDQEVYFNTRHFAR